MSKTLVWLAPCLATLCWPETANAEAVCTVSASGVAFGVYNPIKDTAIDITGTVTLDCKRERADYTIELSTGSSGSYHGRIMRFAGNQLPYQLFLDSARTVIWGDGTGATGVISGTLPQGQKVVTLTVYGRVYGGTTSVPGTYTDAIALTVDYN